MLGTLKGRMSAVVVGVTGASLLLFTALATYLAVDAEVHRAMERQHQSLATAASLLDAEAPEVEAQFGADGAPLRIVWNAEPDLTDHALIDRIGAITGETATVFAYEPANGDFWRRSTNIRKPGGARAVGTKLGADGPVHAEIMRGGIFSGEARILEVDYYTIYFPIHDTKGAIAGILYVGVTKEQVAAAGWEAATHFLTLAVLLTAIAAGVAAYCAAQALGGLDRVREAMLKIAGGRRDAEVPETGRADEIGEVARAVVTFQNAMRDVDALRQREAEADRSVQEARREVLSRLESGIGRLVSAAAQGDFSQRVDVHFEEPELRGLVDGVNRLSQSFDAFLRDIGGALNAVAGGDLTKRVTGSYTGALGAVAGNVNGAIDRLDALVSDIRTAARNVTGATGEISEGSATLSSRTEAQASSLEETAATMEEMSATVKSNAASAAQAADLAAEASGAADRSKRVVGETVDAMQRIEASSTKISDIITVIDSIAFQTNLLALNAAVEAARAGDAGKGFAVVASEVRTLAQRSSEAARDIKGLIDDSSSHVVEGVKLVEATGATLEEMVSAIARVGDTIASIAKASGEQASGVEEITSTVNHLDKMTQENAALADKSASAAQRLSEESRRLASLVDAIKTGAGASLRAA